MKKLILTISGIVFGLIIARYVPFVTRKGMTDYLFNIFLSLRWGTLIGNGSNSGA